MAWNSGASAGVTSRAPIACSASLSDTKNCASSRPPAITASSNARVSSTSKASRRCSSTSSRPRPATAISIATSRAALRSRRPTAAGSPADGAAGGTPSGAPEPSTAVARFSVASRASSWWTVAPARSTSSSVSSRNSCVCSPASMFARRSITLNLRLTVARRLARLPRLVRLRRLCVLLSVVALPLLAWALLPVVSTGADSASLQRRIDRDQAAIDRKKRHEGVLTTDITAFNRRIDSLQTSISKLQSREDRIQADLDAKRAELTQIQEQLRIEHAKLARLKARLAAAKVVLGRRLREIYTADAPDIVTVLLDAHGFADLLERSEFMHRINAQDRVILVAVKKAKDETTATTKRLARREDRAHPAAAPIGARRR